MENSQQIANLPKPNFILEYSPRTQYSKDIDQDDILYNELKVNFDPITIKIVKKHFKERVGILNKDQFVAILKNHLLGFIPNHPDRERILIKLLSRLFSDIDLNDNGKLEWVEFTNYIIHNSNGQDKTQNNKDYRLKFYSPAKDSIKPNEIAEIISFAFYLEKFSMIGVVQEGKSRMMFFDAKKCTKLKCYIDLQEIQSQVDELEFSELNRQAVIQLNREEEDRKKKREILLQGKAYLTCKRTDRHSTASEDNSKDKKKKKKTQPKKLTVSQKDDVIKKSSFNKKLSILAACYINEYDVILISGTNNTITAWQYINGEIKNVNKAKDFKLIKDEFSCAILFSDTLQYTMVWDPQLQYLFTGQKDGKILKWDLTKSKDIECDRLDLSKVREREFLNHNKNSQKSQNEKEQEKKLKEQLILKSLRRRIQGSEGTLEISQKNETVGCLVLLSKLQLLAASYYNGLLILWDPVIKDYRKIYNDQHTAIYSMAFDATKNLLFTCGFSHEIYVYDPYIDNASVYKLSGHDSSINSIDINEKESEMLSLDIKGNIKIWDTCMLSNYQTIKLNETFEDNIKKNHNLDNFKPKKLSSNIRMLYIPKLKKAMVYGTKLLFFETNRANNPELADDQVICACYFDKLSKTIFSFCLRKISLWNLLTGKIKHIYDDPMNNEITALIVDRNIKRAFLGDNTGKIGNINLKNGILIKELTSHNTEIKYICHSMELNYVISCSIDNIIKIHNDKELLETEVVKELAIVQFQVRAICIINRFARLGIGLSNGSIKFYDIEHFHYDSDLGSDSSSLNDEISAMAPIENLELVFCGYSSGLCRLIVTPPSTAKFVSIYKFNISDDKPVAVSITEFDQECHLIFIGDMIGRIKCYNLTPLYDIAAAIKQNSRDPIINKDNYEAFNSMSLQCLWSVEAHKESIKHLHFVDIQPKLLITTSHDFRIKIFKANTGEYKDEFKQLSNRSNPYPIAIKYYLLDPFNNTSNTNTINNTNFNSNTNTVVSPNPILSPNKIISSNSSMSNTHSNNFNANSNNNTNANNIINKPEIKLQDNIHYNHEEMPEQIYYSITRKDIEHFSPASGNDIETQLISEYSKKISEFNAKEKLWNHCKNANIPKNWSNLWKVDIDIDLVKKNEHEEYLKLYDLVKKTEKITLESEAIRQEKSLYSESYKPPYIEAMKDPIELREYAKIINERLRNVKLAVSKANMNHNKMGNFNKKKTICKSQSACNLGSPILPSIIKEGVQPKQEGINENNEESKTIAQIEGLLPEVQPEINLVKKMRPIKKEIISRYASFNSNRMLPPACAFKKYKDDFHYGFKEILVPLTGFASKIRIKRSLMSDFGDADRIEQKRQDLMELAEIENRLKMIQESVRKEEEDCEN